MRRIATVLLCVVSVAASCWASPSVTAFVDEKQELSATVWILAGCEEYDRGVYPPYYRDIQRYFKDFKSHPVMEFIREMRDAPDTVYVVSYNSVPCAARLLYIEDGLLSPYRSQLKAQVYIRHECKGKRCHPRDIPQLHQSRT